MRLGIIDMGTNTFNFLVVEKKYAIDFSIIDFKKFSVKLGGKALYKNIITTDAMIRAINTIKEIKTIGEKYHVTQIKAFATSAVREASNKDNFLAMIKAKTGIEVNVISGCEEAELIFYGVRKAITGIDNVPYLIMDIGGGSTEFIIAEKNRILWKRSFRLGVARLLEYFHISDPVTEKEIVKIEQYLNENLTLLTKEMQKYNITTLIGSSGSFSTIVSLIINQLYSHIQWRPSTFYVIAAEDYILIHRLLVLSTFNERKHMKGMDPMRIEMMVPATIFIKFVIKKYQIERLIQSAYALKEGAAIKLLKINENG